MRFLVEFREYNGMTDIDGELMAAKVLFQRARTCQRISLKTFHCVHFTAGRTVRELGRHYDLIMCLVIQKLKKWVFSFPFYIFLLC